MVNNKKNIIDLVEERMKRGEISPIVLPDTDDDPFAQVKYIFNWLGDQFNSKSSQSNYKDTALSAYLRYLESTNDYRESEDASFLLSQHWDDFALVRFKTWFETNNVKGEVGYMGPKTQPGLFSALRMTMKLAMREKLAAC